MRYITIAALVLVMSGCGVLHKSLTVEEQYNEGYTGVRKSLNTKSPDPFWLGVFHGIMDQIEANDQYQRGLRIKALIDETRFERAAREAAVETNEELKEDIKKLTEYP